MTVDTFNASDANHVLNQISDETHGVVRSGAPEEELTEIRTAYMRYVGQGHEIEIPLPNRDLKKKISH